MKKKIVSASAFRFNRELNVDNWLIINIDGNYLVSMLYFSYKNFDDSYIKCALIFKSHFKTNRVYLCVYVEIMHLTNFWREIKNSRYKLFSIEIKSINENQQILTSFINFS